MRVWQDRHTHASPSLCPRRRGQLLLRFFDEIAHILFTSLRLVTVKPVVVDFMKIL